MQSHNGTVFYDEEGYAYRVNKKQPGKLYVRCADTKCPVRGSLKNTSIIDVASYSGNSSIFLFQEAYLDIHFDLTNTLILIRLLVG